MNNLRILGDGSFNGGEFNKISVLGDGVIMTDAIAKKISVLGDVTFKGRVEADELRVTGTAIFEGDAIIKRGRVLGDVVFKQSLVMEALKVSGQATFEGMACVKTLRNFGQCVVMEEIKSHLFKNLGAIHGDGTIRATTFESFGLIDTGGDIEGESLILRGEIKNANLINGEEVLLVLYANCQCEQLGATKLTVRPRDKKKDRWFVVYAPDLVQDHYLLSAKQIEGDILHLSYTQTDVACGDVVHVGKHCHIKHVEYGTELTIDPRAQVVERVKR